jgi:hypothetical protein
MYNGAITIQRLVNDWIMHDTGANEKGYSVAENAVRFVSFPTRKYTKDGFYAQIARKLYFVIHVTSLSPLSSNFNIYLIIFIARTLNSVCAPSCLSRTNIPGQCNHQIDHTGKGTPPTGVDEDDVYKPVRDRLVLVCFILSILFLLSNIHGSCNKWSIFEFLIWVLICLLGAFVSCYDNLCVSNRGMLLKGNTSDCKLVSSGKCALYNSHADHDRISTYSASNKPQLSYFLHYSLLVC